VTYLSRRGDFSKKEAGSLGSSCRGVYPAANGETYVQTPRMIKQYAQSGGLNAQAVEFKSLAAEI
jgi:hypothetical protein